jgi:uncharacterized membrane protein YgcG
VTVERGVDSSSEQVNGTHGVSQTTDDRSFEGQYTADRVQLAVVENEFASVTISLDRAGHSPRLHVRDNETGDDILLSAIELASLCLATSDDRAGWLKVGLYRDQGNGASGGSDGGAPRQGGAPGSSAAGE